MGIERLLEEPYSLILCYPKPDPRELEARIEELKRMGVEGLVFEGRAKLFGLGLLGKGNTGLVVKAIYRGREAALKIKRIDSRREGARREGEMLSLANSLGIGPKLISYSENFVLMELIKGERIGDWLPRCGKGELKAVLRELLDQCFRLDEAGIDHGELSDPRRHVLVSGSKPYILDFERASLARRPSNLTSLVQYFSIGGPYSSRVRRMLGFDLDGLIDALRLYKSRRGAETFARVLEALRL